MTGSPKGIDHHQDASVRDAAEPTETRLLRRVLQIRTIQGIGVEKNSDGVIEADAVLIRVGLRLPWIPLEHDFSIYLISLRRTLGVVRVECHLECH